MKQEKENVVLFSGGKDSTALLLMALEKGIKISRAVNVDTGKEFPQMYKHIEKVKRYIAPIKIMTLKMDYDFWFGEHIMQRGDREGEKGYGWPHPRMRWCTGLKIEAMRYMIYNNKKNYFPQKRSKAPILNMNNITEFHGIAYDEKHRLVSLNPNMEKWTLQVRAPLVEWKITEKEALEYCFSKGFDFGGLYDKMKRVSCFCCPLQKMNSLRIIYNDYPEQWEAIKEMDKKSHRQFRYNYSVDDLAKKFLNENNRKKNTFSYKRLLAKKK